MNTSLNWNRAATCAAPFPGVEQAMVEGLHALPADRGAQGQSTAEHIFSIRARAASLFGFSFPERVLFTPGATYGLNLAIHCGITEGSHVLSTASEHNSMLRPLHQARHRGIHTQILPFTETGQLDLDALSAALKKGEAQWLAMCVASNTLGVIQPFAEACRLAREADVGVILDLSQGGGQIAIHLDALDVDYAAVAGHKGIHGPRGIGLLFVSPRQSPEPLIQGGTGTEGTLLEMPSSLPSRLEAGTSNYPGIFGLGAALDWLSKHPPELAPVRKRLAQLELWCREQAAFDVFPTASCDWSHRLPLLALRPRGFSAEMVAQFLAQKGIFTRAGSMCTTQILPALKAQEGLLRLSPPTDASDKDFERVRCALQEALTVFG